jgi:hypothetical protein
MIHLPKKPLGKPSYGSIPHLPCSRLGPGDHYISHGQAKICTEKARDRNDVIIVQEKLDGANVGVVKLNNQLLAISRAGYLVSDSPHRQLRMFGEWVERNRTRFDELLNEGERVCGEWLAMAAGTVYDLPHEPFVAFDIMTGSKRIPFDEFRIRATDFIQPMLISIGEPFPIESMIECIKVSGHGAIDPVEGAIYRVERNGIVDFLAKYVHRFKQDGKYFEEVSGKPAVWNINTEDYNHIL